CDPVGGTRSQAARTVAPSGGAGGGLSRARRARAGGGAPQPHEGDRRIAVFGRRTTLSCPPEDAGRARTSGFNPWGGQPSRRRYRQSVEGTRRYGLQKYAGGFACFGTCDARSG